MISEDTFSEDHVSALRVNALQLYNLSSDNVLEIMKYIQKKVQMLSLWKIIRRSEPVKVYSTPLLSFENFRNLDVKQFVTNRLYMF